MGGLHRLYIIYTDRFFSILKLCFLIMVSGFLIPVLNKVLKYDCSSHCIIMPDDQLNVRITTAEPGASC